MIGKRVLAALTLVLPVASAADNEEGIGAHMDANSVTAETPTKCIRDGDSWTYSVTGFFAGGFRVCPLSGKLRYAASSSARVVPESPEVLALSYDLDLAGGGRPFPDRGVIYLHQHRDGTLVEHGTEADGWIERGPVQYLPGTLSTGFRSERDFTYVNGAAERGVINVAAFREIETPAGEYRGFKVEDRHRRTEPDGAYSKVNDTGWFVPELGFFARGTVTIRSYDAQGRFQHFQLHGFQLERTTVTE
ncbi:hypothetical protein [Thiohalorhabdus methylotrophus]|uniref:Uncharacterized protein n=1 Tax=Thiohalorhabdus methylotrophus TaxID=3242694 RepID=A0ABV4TTR6_9GAMM